LLNLESRLGKSGSTSARALELWSKPATVFQPDKGTRVQQNKVAARLYVKSKLHHVAILHDVVFTFHANLALSFGFCHGAGGNKIIERNYFGFDKPALKIGMDNAGCLWSTPTLLYGPGPSLLGACS
jgi:hypothetical protein